MTTEEFIQHLSRLVAIPSVAGNPHALHQAVDFMADFVAARASVTIERFEQNGKPSFLAYKKGSRPDTFGLILNAHVDVVPPGTPESFMSYEQSGRLYGCGVLDMKGTAIVLASVFCELVNEVDYPLALQIVSDEEIGGFDGTRHQAEMGVHAEMAIMGEYGNTPNVIYNGARGTGWVEVAVKGQSSHAGHPWKGDNAITKAARLITALEHKYPIPTEESWVTTVSATEVSTTNEAQNKIPDYTVVKFDVRFTNTDLAFQNEESVRALLARLEPDAELIGIHAWGPAVAVAEDHPYVRGLHNAITRNTKQPVKYSYRSGASDARHMALYNIPCVEFGLLGDGSHSEDEYLEIASFEPYQRIMRDFVRMPKA